MLQVTQDISQRRRVTEAQQNTEIDPWDLSNQPRSDVDYTQQPEPEAKVTAFPVINGCLTVDISRYIDQWGHPTDEANRHAWNRIRCSAAGISIRLVIGGLTFPMNLIYHLVDAGILDAAVITVEGSEPKGVEGVLRALRGVRDRRTAA